MRVFEKKNLRNKYHVFNDRVDAGRKLANFLKEKDLTFDVMLAIASGGIPVAEPISISYGMKTYVAVTKKITYPWTTEAGFGAISWTFDIVIDEDIIKLLSKEEIDEAITLAKTSVEKRIKIFNNFLPPDIKDSSVLVIDDGLATGYTMLATVKSCRKLGASQVHVAVPTAHSAAMDLLVKEVDTISVLNIRDIGWFAVADAYKYWRDLSEEEVLIILKGIWKRL